MEIKYSYDKHFVDLLESIKSEYSSDLFDLEGIGKQLDISHFSKQYFKTNVLADISVDSNANVDDNSVIAYQKESTKAHHRLNSLYLLWRTMREQHGYKIASEMVTKQLLGEIYIGDLHGATSHPYCFNYSTYDIMINGLTPVKKIKSIPPKHLYSFKSQLEQFVVIASNSTLGATGLADLFITMSYYVKNILETGADAHFSMIDVNLAVTFTEEQKKLYNESLKSLGKEGELSIAEKKILMKPLLESFTEEQRKLYEDNIYRYVRENLVSFIYTINQPMRGEQSAFTNVSVYDDVFLESMCKDYIFPDGSSPDKEIIKKIQVLFLKLMNEELRRTPITFPVTTACFSIDEDRNLQDEEFLDMISELNREWGFINIYIGKTSTLSSCCRLRSDVTNEYFNAFGSGSSKIGSQGVVTINLPRIAYQATSKEDYLARLRKLVALAARTNNARRIIIQKRIDNGNHPLYSLGFIDLDKQYSTAGVNGLNEAVEIMGMDILTEEGQQFALDIIDTINMVNDKMQEHFKKPHNCEQVPGENISIKLAAKDAFLGYNKKYPIYSNQFIPLTTEASLLDRIKLQGLFDSKFSGGSICHLNLDTEVSKERIKELIITCASLGVIYFAINYNLQECKEGHMSVSKGDICTVCGAEIVANYTRVVGFLTCTKNWHKKRRELDYPNRQFYSSLD